MIIEIPIWIITTLKFVFGFITVILAIIGAISLKFLYDFKLRW